MERVLQWAVSLPPVARNLVLLPFRLICVYILVVMTAALVKAAREMTVETVVIIALLGVVWTAIAIRNQSHG